MDTVVAVLGTLAGTVIGAFATYLTQRAQFRREQAERLRVERRQAYSNYLGSCHDVFVEVRALTSAARSDKFEGVQQRLDMRTVPTAPGQAALEELRLLSGDDVGEAAAALWAHLRKRGIPQGAKHSNAEWREFTDAYWVARRSFIDACRAESGVGPLNWERASVTLPADPRGTT